MSSVGFLFLLILFCFFFLLISTIKPMYLKNSYFSFEDVFTFYLLQTEKWFLFQHYLYLFFVFPCSGFLFHLPPFACFCAPVVRSVNQPGLTGSCGVSEPRLLPPPPPPAQSPVPGSAAPFQVWPVGPKWHSTITEATWSIQSATINLSPPSSPCRWDMDPEVVLKVTSFLLTLVYNTTTLLHNRASCRSKDNGSILFFF